MELNFGVFQSIFRKQIFKTFCIAYSSALKKIYGVPSYTSNHFVVEMTNQFLFNYVMLHLARFLKD